MVPVAVRSRVGTSLTRGQAKPEEDCCPFMTVRIRPVPEYHAVLWFVLSVSVAAHKGPC